MAKENKQLTVFVGICIKNKKILMCLRNDPAFPDAHLKWELPGGKCDFGETPEESLKREFLEETGMEITVGKMIPFVYTHYWKYEGGIQQTFVITYECSYIRSVTTPHDHKVKEVKWILLEKLKEYELLNGTEAILKKGLPS